MKKEVLLFVLLPIIFNLLFLGLYFSGLSSLQQIIAPRMETLYQPSWREFGMVEQTQNILLLFAFGVLFYAALKRKISIEKYFFAFGSLIILLLFLEEIDYGLHFAHYFLNNATEIPRFNWHNQQTFSGKENGHYLKQASDLICTIWFLLVPMVKTKCNFRPLASIMPCRWFIAALIISFMFSPLAHYLNDQGFGIINNQQGLLNGNISEFRETSTYYLFLLYALQLAKKVDFRKD